MVVPTAGDGERGVAASHGWKPGVRLNPRKHRKPLPQRMIQLTMSVMLRLGNPGSEKAEKFRFTGWRCQQGVRVGRWASSLCEVASGRRELLPPDLRGESRPLSPESG